MSNPMRQLPTIAQLASRVFEQSKDLKLHEAIMESQQAQIQALVQANEEVMGQVAELNLQMKFLMAFFTLTTESPIAGLDGKREKITRPLSHKYMQEREKLIELLQQEIADGEGADESQPQGNGSVAAQTDATTVADKAVESILSGHRNGTTH